MIKAIDDIKNIYFLGIGGIGMSALARFFNSKGVKVSGFDRRSTPLTKSLEEEGMDIQYEENIHHIPSSTDIFVYTPAIPNDSVLLNFAKDSEKPVLKRSELLEKVSKDLECIAIAGTHGKTTITTMTAFLLQETGFGCNAFLGGLSANYNTNFWANERELIVVEADEYDRSFLRLHPDVAVISAVSADHLDIFGDAENVEEAFHEFIDKISAYGYLVKNQRVHLNIRREDLQLVTYGLDKMEGTDIWAENIVPLDGGFSFDIVDRGTLIPGFYLKMGGRHNVENVLAAYTIARLKGIELDKIKEAMADFRGVKRRYEYKIQQDGYVYIDDYAHHPEELFQLLNGVKKAFPEKKVRIIFQPHLFSRTKSFYKEFGESLSIADEVILLPIYPARELPMKGVNSEMMIPFIAEKDKKVSISNFEKVLEEMIFSKDEILITAGAGDIDQIVEKIVEKFKDWVGNE